MNQQWVEYNSLKCRACLHTEYEISSNDTVLFAQRTVDKLKSLSETETGFWAFKCLEGRPPSSSTLATNGIKNQRVLTQSDCSLRGADNEQTLITPHSLSLCRETVKWYCTSLTRSDSLKRIMLHSTGFILQPTDFLELPIRLQANSDWVFGLK